MRVAFVQFPDFRRIYLVTLFLKKSTENLSAADGRDIHSLLSQLERALHEGQNP